MAERLTIYEVAREAGVSIASVSRVFHDQPGVSAATRDRVRAIMRQFGYLPNGAARALAGRRGDRPGVSRPGGSQAGSGARQLALRRRGWSAAPNGPPARPGM